MSTMAADDSAIAPGAFARPLWRRYRGWLLLVAAVLLAAIAVTTWTSTPGRTLDPASTQPNGGHALSRLLAGYGVTVRPTSSAAVAGRGARAAALLVTEPDSYSAAQLRALRAAAGRLVLVSPGTEPLAALAPGIEPDTVEPVDPEPDCADPGARAAGAVDFSDGARTYDDPGGATTRCYGGGYLTTPALAILADGQLLRNDHLAGTGVAALDINAITDSRRLTSVVWLLPGPDAQGSGPATIWDVFPSGAYRAFWWLAAVGVLLALWRGRRLGGVLPEPLPVVVRSAELVEGHGRLYRRAGARDRAAAALRSAAAARLVRRLGLPRAAGPEQIGVAAAPPAGRPPADVVALLAGPPPADDGALIDLARDLDALTAAVTERTAQ